MTLKDIRSIKFTLFIIIFFSLLNVLEASPNSTIRLGTFALNINQSLPNPTQQNSFVTATPRPLTIYEFKLNDQSHSLGSLYDFEHSYCSVKLKTPVTSPGPHSLYRFILVPGPEVYLTSSVIETTSKTTRHSDYPGFDDYESLTFFENRYLLEVESLGLGLSIDCKRIQCRNNFDNEEQRPFPEANLTEFRNLLFPYFTLLNIDNTSREPNVDGGLR